MTYFVTGATGFIGRHLVERLLERDGDIHVLVREGSRERLDRLVARWGGARPTASSPSPATCSGRGSASSDEDVAALTGNVDHFFHLAAMYDMTAGDATQRAAQRRRHAQRGRARQRARRGPPAPRVLGRRRRRAQGPLPRGHVRRGPEAAVGLPPDEVRVREARARGGEGAVARLPPGDRRRPLADRRDGQDRRPVLLLQGDPEGAPRAARVGAADRPRARLHEHRAGRLRRRRDGPHRPSARPELPGVSPHEPEADARRRVAERVREGRARAAARAAHRQAPDRRAAEGHAVDAVQAAAGARHPAHDAGRLRHPRGGRRAHGAEAAVRHARHRARAGGLRHRGARSCTRTPSRCGTTGSASSIPTCTRTARSRTPSTGARSSSPARRAASAARPR